jgi:hypothetical protein
MLQTQDKINRKHINISNTNNNSGDSSFHTRAGFETPDDGHLGTKHVVEGF